MQGNSSASSELTALQRLAAAGSEPLLAVGRAVGAHLMHSLGSTTSVAITGGLGLIRLGLGNRPSDLRFISRACMDAQNKLLWRDKTCPART